MKIFKDVFSGDELFSDTYRWRLVNDVVYEIYGKHISRSWEEIQLEGSNASTEEANEATGETSESGVDVVLNHRLVETCFRTKKDYTKHLKDYMKRLIKYLEDNNRGGEVEQFKTNITQVLKNLLGKFEDLQFFTGESIHADGMIMILHYKEVDGEETPCLISFKHGLLEEKC